MSHCGRLVICGLILILVGPRFASAQLDKKAKEEEQAKAFLKNLFEKAEDDYRRFFKKPETAIEFWSAMKAELDVGKFELAALHLKLFLDPPPELKIDAKAIDDALAKVEEANGMFAFLRLRTIKKWSTFEPFQRETEKNVEILIDRATTAVNNHLEDPVRINKFIRNLEAKTVEERTFAFMQLKRSKERVTPHLIETLRTTVGKSLNVKVREAMVALEPDIIPPLLEILRARDEKDAASTDLRMTLLDIIRRRGDKRAIPYLWHLSAWNKYPAEVRDRALSTLAYLLETTPARLPEAKVALVALAERYYQRKVKFLNPNRIRFWPWDGERIVELDPPLTAGQAEEYFGLRYAKQALQLDPTYQPAQMVFLNLTLDRTLGPKFKDLLFEKLPPNLHKLLLTIDPDLLITLLERAMQDRNMPIVLTALQILGERGERKAARDPASGPTSGVVKALYYPDRRVQYAAMLAMLNMPKSQTPVAAGRIVELLSRFTAADPIPRALMIGFPVEQVAEFRKLVKEAGFEPESAAPTQVKGGAFDFKAPFKILNASADFDAVIIHPAVGAELTHVLTQLRSDYNYGLLPVLVIAPKGREEDFNLIAQRYRNVKVITEVQATLPNRIKDYIETGTQEYAGLPLSEKERKRFTNVSLNELWRMARGEVVGYDIRPALPAVQKVALNEDTAVQAIEILGRTPGVDIQQRLAAVLLDPARAKVRIPAAIELNRNIQKFGLSLTKQQIADIRLIYKEDVMPEVRAQLGVMVGNFRTSTVTTGNLLRDFRPDQPPPPKKDVEKEK